ncbi:MAG: putative glycoside hydrolase [Formivibrio sp.]|nr:putative glycoside hydrolase [Formivibrio sp.]
MKTVLRLLIALLVLTPPAYACDGKVFDERSGQPLADAMVTRGTEVVLTGQAGQFHFAGSCGTIAARAIGYRRSTMAQDQSVSEVTLHLAPFRPKALYLSFWGIGDRSLRENALALIDRTELNALVIDVKGDRGRIPYPSRVAMAQAVGARNTTTVADMPALVAALKKRGIYLIARIVVFKDDPLASAHPEWAVKTARGTMFRDLENLAWVDPARPEVWAYNLDIAAEAAELGFDEIQFDYVRFPDTPGLVFSVPDTEESRIATISGFLAAARKRLAPFNVFVAADIFGYVCWNLNDTFIGQRLDTLAAQLDYISPMLYPSGFKFGIPGYANAVAHPYEIVDLSLRRAVERTGLSPLRFRPWLQAFRDYAFDHRAFAGPEIRMQIEAAEKSDADGWMLWNPRNVYSADGIRKE